MYAHPVHFKPNANNANNLTISTVAKAIVPFALHLQRLLRVLLESFQMMNMQLDQFLLVFFFVCSFTFTACSSHLFFRDLCVNKMSVIEEAANSSIDAV